MHLEELVPVSQQIDAPHKDRAEVPSRIRLDVPVEASDTHQTLNVVKGLAQDSHHYTIL